MKTKKIISAILCIVMSAALCACGNGTKFNTPDTLTDGEIKFADFLPTIEIEGTFTKVQGPTGDTYETIAYYENKDQTSPDKAIALYAWEKTDTLFNEAKWVLNEYYPDAEYDPVETEEDGLKSVYFCALDKDRYEEVTYCSSYFFENEGKTYELDFFTPVEKIALGDTGVYFYGPAGMQELAISEEEKANGCIAFRHDEYGLFCDYKLYIWPASADSTFESNIEWYKEEKENVEVIDYYTVTSESGKEYKGLYLSFNDEVDGVKNYNIEFAERIGETYIYLDCVIPDGTNNPALTHSVGALSYGFENYP